MVAFYILIITFSAWLLAFALLRVGGKVASILGNPTYISAGLIFVIISVSFLIVVSAGSSMLVGAVLLLVAQLLDKKNLLPEYCRWAIPLIAAALAVSTMTIPAVEHVPSLLLRFTGIIALFGLVYAAPQLPSENIDRTAAVLLACLTPLILTPILGAPDFVAIDVAILYATMIGVLQASRRPASLALARAPVLLIAGWLVLQCLAHGAWIAAILGAAGCLGALLYSVHYRHRHPQADA